MWLYPWTNKTSMLGAGGGQSGTEVLMGTERGSCSEMSDPVTQIWRQCPLCWCSGKKFVFPWMEIRICLLSWPPLSDDVPNSTLVHSLTGFLHLSSPAVHLQNILTFHTLFLPEQQKLSRWDCLKPRLFQWRPLFQIMMATKKQSLCTKMKGLGPPQHWKAWQSWNLPSKRMEALQQVSSAVTFVLFLWFTCLY